jgi:hypothetical protein
MAKDVANVTTAMTFEEWFGAFIRKHVRGSAR